MPREVKSQRAWGNGEIDPRAQQRSDLKAYKTSLAKLINSFVLVQGGISRRQGFEHIQELTSNVNENIRLIPFIFSDTENYICVFEGTSLRIFNPRTSAFERFDGDSPYPQAQLFEIRYIQSFDVMTLTHPAFPPMELRREEDDEGRIFKLQPIIIQNPTQPPIISSIATVTTETEEGQDPRPRTTYQYKITQILDGQESIAKGNVLGDLVSVETDEDDSSLSVITVSAAHGLEVGDNVYFRYDNEPLNVDGILKGNEEYAVRAVPSDTTFKIRADVAPVVPIKRYVSAGSSNHFHRLENYSHVRCTIAGGAGEGGGGRGALHTVDLPVEQDEMIIVKIADDDELGSGGDVFWTQRQSGRRQETYQEYVCTGSNDGPSCFVAGTKVLMADGTEKNIEDVRIGEELQGDETINKVLEYDSPMLDGRPLVSINGSTPFMTPEHPVKTRDGWKAYDSAWTIEAYPHMKKLMKGDLKSGDVVETIDGWLLAVRVESSAGHPQQQVHNFKLDGDKTYFANGFLVHNRG